MICMFLFPNKGTLALHNSNSKLLENWAWVRNSLTKSQSYLAHVTHIQVTKTVPSMEASQENIGNELLRDENNSIDGNSENVEIDDDKISISSVEETFKTQNLCLQSRLPYSILFKNKPRHLLVMLHCPIQWYQLMLVFTKCELIIQGKETK